MNQVKNKYSTYKDFYSVQKQIQNRVICLLANSENKGLFVILDGEKHRTTSALVAAGVDQKRICIVERNAATFQIMKKSLNAEHVSVKLFFGDFFLFLLECARQKAHIYAIVADMMQLTFTRIHLDILGAIARDCGLRHLFYTLTVRGESTFKKIKFIRHRTVGRIMKGLRLVYGYQRDHVGTDEREEAEEEGEGGEEEKGKEMEKGKRVWKKKKPTDSVMSFVWMSRVKEKTAYSRPHKIKEVVGEPDKVQMKIYSIAEKDHVAEVPRDSVFLTEEELHQEQQKKRKLMEEASRKRKRIVEEEEKEEEEKGGEGQVIKKRLRPAFAGGRKNVRPYNSNQRSLVIDITASE